MNLIEEIKKKVEQSRIELINRLADDDVITCIPWKKNRIKIKINEILKEKQEIKNYSENE